MKLLVLLLSFSAVYAKNCGSINIDGVGEIYLVSGNCGAIQIHDNGWTANGGYGLSFAKEASDSFYPEMYWAVSILQIAFFNHQSYIMSSKDTLE